MSKLAKSIWGGLLFAGWLMCFVFPVNLIMTFSDHTPIGTFLVQQVVDFFFLWAICGVIAHGVIGLFDDVNKRGRRDDRDHDGRDNSEEPRSGEDKPKDDSHPGDSGPKQ
jgi:hypothetical protein